MDLALGNMVTMEVLCTPVQSHVFCEVTHYLASFCINLSNLCKPDDDFPSLSHVKST